MDRNALERSAIDRHRTVRKGSRRSCADGLSTVRRDCGWPAASVRSLTTAHPTKRYSGDFTDMTPLLWQPGRDSFPRLLPSLPNIHQTEPRFFLYFNFANEKNDVRSVGSKSRVVYLLNDLARERKSATRNSAARRATSAVGAQRDRRFRSTSFGLTPLCGGSDSASRRFLLPTNLSVGMSSGTSGSPLRGTLPIP